MPALIGDFLITDDQGDRAHVWLPTRPNLNQHGHPPLPRRVSGLGRKIHQVNDRFVVGCTGGVAAAKVILADLERRFASDATSPSPGRIGNALSQFNIQFSGAATIIGWTVNDEPRCFALSARLGSRIQQVEMAVEGSGRKHFTSMLTDAVSFGYSSAVENNQDKALLLGLAKLGAVLTEEISSGNNLVWSYGYGAEMVLFNGQRFECVSGAGYTFWNFKLELDG